MAIACRECVRKILMGAISMKVGFLGAVVGLLVLVLALDYIACSLLHCCALITCLSFVFR
jgi:hypothetical protein